MPVRYSVDRDLEEARAMAEGLEEYVRGERLYGNVSGGGMFSTDSDMPTLTLGAMLMRLRRLQKLEKQLTPEQRATLTQVEAEHDRVRQAWNYAYQGKLHNEAGARLHSLEAFFAECDGDPQACAEAYLPEASRRTMLDAIVEALHKYNLPAIDLDNSLRQHDEQLRRLTSPSDFIWDEMLKPAYPENKYWWLYARPQVEERQGEDTNRR